MTPGESQKILRPWFAWLTTTRNGCAQGTVENGAWQRRLETFTKPTDSWKQNCRNSLNCLNCKEHGESQTSLNPISKKLLQDCSTPGSRGWRPWNAPTALKHWRVRVKAWIWLKKSTTRYCKRNSGWFC